MELIDVITSKENLNSAYKKVVANKGAGGVDGMEVEELGMYIKENKDRIIQSIRNRTYMPKPVRRVNIPKDNGKHDKLIQILREQVNDSTTLNLIRKYLKAGVMEKGLEQRGLRFTRYADDTMIFTKSEMAANRVMKSITDWIERKLFLKVNATKTKVVRPTRSKYLGFTFLKNGGEWKVKPTTEKKKKLKQKLSEYLKRNKAIARPLAITIKRVNEIVRGWINYFRIGMMKGFMDDFGQWLRHKIRVIVMKQWKTPKTIYKNLSYMNRKYECGFDHESIYKVANFYH